MSDADKPADNREPATIENEIEATRDRLADTIDQLAFRANPKNIAKREVDSLKAHFVDARGNPRTDNIVKVASGVAGFVAVLVVIRMVAK